ncbi:MAG TPA: Rid family detoxifying hydrolase [Candidatus Limnocylindria bacterium]|jgi:2-iminobutanoate/2-iminopropanoate deaminase
MSPRSPVRTEHAAAALAAYSQGMVGGGLVFTAGSLGVDPATNELVEGGAGPQATQAIANLRAVLETAGSGLDRVLKTTVFLVDMGDFAEVNEAYAAAFPEPYPARSAFAVVSLPRGGRVEIECVALAGEDADPS